MRIEVNTDEAATDICISITCSRLSPEIERIVALLRMMDQHITGKKDNQVHLIAVEDALYIESVDRKCFLYTENACYEVEFKLYELEEQFGACGFFRVSKSTLINLRRVKSIKTEFNRRLLVTMANGEQIIASRKYAEQLKQVLGVK